MNFLAHLYLSGEEEKVMLGNFIGDYVKGSAYLEYPERIGYGITLHRRIDRFTDLHPLIRASAVFFKPEYGRYAGIVIDVIFDHLLAQNWELYSTYRLRDFTRKSHAVFLSHFSLLPSRVKRFLPFLIQSRRLESYSSEKGIYKALEIMSRYTSLPAKQDFALYTLQKYKPELLSNFNTFMEELIIYVEDEFRIKIKRPPGQFNSEN